MHLTLRHLLAILPLAVSACGGGGGNGGATGQDNSAAARCAANAGTGQAYECALAGLPTRTRFELIGAPEGMAVHPDSGYLYWTPMPGQTGSHAVTVNRQSANRASSETLTLEVSTAVPVNAAGLYISPSGDDSNAGDAGAPLASLQEAASRATPGTTIYLRGGDYFNQGFGTDYASRSRNSLARITNSGTSTQWITVRPHGNEYVRLNSDVNGIAFRGARYWRLQNLELVGNAQQLDEEDSLRLWWDEGPSSNQIKGRGISMNASFFIEILHCVVHHFPGAGISNNDGAWITVADSVLYNNAWWSTAGTHGVANSKPATEDNTDTTSFKVRMQRNLVFGNQSSMISHVFSKGFVTLEIDEGNGLHMQNNAGSFFGRYLAEDNLLLLNGKAGLGLNTVDGSVIRRNAFYANAQAVAGNGELSLQSSSSDSIRNNLFQARPDRDTIRTSGGYDGVGSNYAVPSTDTGTLPPSVVQVPAVFADPVAGDFGPASGIPDGQGPADSAYAGFDRWRQRLALQFAAAPTLVNAAYLHRLRAEILQSWPAPDPGDSIPDDLILIDRESGFCYRYADRNDYPGPPSSGTACP